MQRPQTLALLPSSRKTCNVLSNNQLLYTWTPGPDLSSEMIDEFWCRNFDIEQIPLCGSEGASFWDELFRKQFSPSDQMLTISSESLLMRLLASERDRYGLQIAKTQRCLDKNKKCHKCKLNIEYKSLMILISRSPDESLFCLLQKINNLIPESFPTNAFYHPQCFRCEKCNELLAAHHYCSDLNANIFCLRHFFELLRPRCRSCDSLIFDQEYVLGEEDDEQYHMEHFNCSSCQNDLAGASYIQHESQPFCVTCYEKNFSNVCDECQRPIGVEGKDLAYKERHWHEQCFVCSECKNSLVGVAFGSRDDRIYCSSCFDAAFGVKCKACEKILKPGDRKLDYHNEQYHADCFRCAKCESPIGTKSFLTKNGSVYCSPCYQTKFATRCIKCCEVILDNGILYKDEPWHRTCFLCTECKIQLSGTEFLSRDGQAFCRGCYAQRFANRCTACKQPIMATTGAQKTRFISFEAQHWHTECFTCTDCRSLLEGRGFIRDGSDIVCADCAKVRLTSADVDVELEVEA